MTRPYDPANPLHPDLTDDSCTYFCLTKRELFAAMAMQGINSNPECYGMSSQYKASSALQDADALIKSLNAEQ